MNLFSFWACKLFFYSVFIPSFRQSEYFFPISHIMNLFFFSQISKPHEAVIGKTVSVVDAAMASCDKTAYVRSAVESIVKLVDVLLNVPTCGHANNSNLLDDSDSIRDVSPTRLMEQVSSVVFDKTKGSLAHKGKYIAGPVEHI